MIKIKITAGAKHSFFNQFNQEKEVTIHDGAEFFHKYLFPHDEDIKDHFELKTTAFVGGMGSGKSSSFRFEVNFIRNYWGWDQVNAVMTDNVQLAMENFTQHPIQIIIIDDAMTKQDSRRSMGDENVTATQQFMLIRHLAKEMGFGGVIYVIWAFQDPTGIDKRFRNTCDVVIFKQYYIEFDARIKKLIKDEESIDFLKYITEQQAFNDFSYRSFGVGYTKWGSIINVKFPYVKEDEFKVGILDSTLRKDQITNELIDLVIEKGFTEESTQVAYGFLHNLKNERKELDVYNFSQSDFQRILWRAKANELVEGIVDTTSKEEEYLYKCLAYLRDNEGWSYAGIENQTGIPHSYSHRLMQKFDGKKESSLDLFEATLTRLPEGLRDEYIKFVMENVDLRPLLEAAGIDVKGIKEQREKNP